MFVDVICTRPPLVTAQVLTSVVAGLSVCASVPMMLVFPDFVPAKFNAENAMDPDAD